MSIVSALKTQVDLPVWEWTRFAPTASAAISSTCVPDNTLNVLQGRYVYYLQASAVFYRYDTWTDAWEVLTPPVTALATFSSMTALENFGHEGRVLSATSTTFTAPGISAKLAVGYDVTIISGTGAGQRRIITSVAEPVVADTGIATGVTCTTNTYTTGCNLTDSTKAWTINQYAGYQCRIAFGTAVGQVRKILYNSATVLTFSDTAKMGEDYLSVPQNFTPAISATAGSQSVYAIESSVFTVDTAWGTTPDATSRFRISTGVIVLLSGAAATPFYTLQFYDIATDFWYQKTAQTLLVSNAMTDGCIDHTTDSSSTWSRGIATAGTVTSLTDGIQGWAVNQWTGYQLFIFSGTGKGQTSLITSNTATVLTLTSTLGTAPDATSQYMIQGYSGGTASSGATTTLTDSTQTWTVNQWTNYAVKILAGTGAGQVLPIASNTATVLTVVPRSIVSGSAGGFSPSPDNTSIYTIIGDPDRCYFIEGANSETLIYNIDDDLTSLGRMGDSGTCRIGSVQYGNWKPIAISTLTSVTTTATCTTVNNHNLQTGYSVTIAGETTNPTKYNITATITVTTATAFTYTIVSVSGAAGTFGANGTTTLVDGSKNWTSNQWAGYILYYTTTAGAAPTGFASLIASNTATVLTFATGTAPVNGTTRYIIGGTSTAPSTIIGNITPGTAATTTTTNGQCTGTQSTTLITDTNKAWVVNLYAGRKVKITSNTGQGQESTIASNTATALTIAAVTTAPVTALSTYAILEPAVYSTGTSLKWAYGTGGPSTGSIGGGPLYANNYGQMLTPATNLLWGRYLYASRGGALVGFNRLDLTTDHWVMITTQPNSETLTSGSQFAYDSGNRLYFTPQVTGRMYYLDLVTNTIHGGGTVPYTAGTAILSQVMQIFTTADSLKYLWLNRQSNIECFRCLLFW